ncbi:hypothetical protein HYFRA_00004499 [Hymenoscyphus fraxineus]|uniref:Prion-inhibition and propagation HeLo domain-containing protein n=1 Tax=Hymenoscyphus fraxineus TaxID=746836 RepID=A0A9N9L020_9HELO|nr:hypothetical protein HYFRA_00004499 [Hymenoscyphus fraxineus]
MAETFGVVAGIVGLAGAFSGCVDCFEYIQLGRRFAQDYGACQLKLDILSLRLSRWGLAVGLSDNSNENGRVQPKVTATEQELQRLADVLEELYEDLREASKKSERFRTKTERNATTENSNQCLQVLDPEKELRNDYRLLHVSTTNIVARRKRNDLKSGFWNNTKWALYEKKAFDHLVDNITGHIDTLENVFPAVNEALAETSKAELSGITDDDDLKLLAITAGDSDKTLVETVKKTLAERGDTWTDFNISLEESGQVQVGHEFGAGMRPTAASSWSTFKIGGKGFTQVGHRFSGGGDMSSDI